MSDKSVYEFKYPDGTMEKLTAKIIDENILSQVDTEGQQYQVLTEVTDHKRYEIAISKEYGFIKYSNENLHQKRTNTGWKRLVERKEISVDWVPLNERSQSNPV